MTYLQITPRSRSEIREYADIERMIDETAGRINGTYGEASWTPIRYVNRTHSRSALVGLYRSARAALVTPLRDGMNLVAKEYVAAQDTENPGVLILSRFAGAAVECEAALLVNPYDPELVGIAIARALSMPLEERRARHDAMFQVLLTNDVKFWGERFLTNLTRPSNFPNRLGQMNWHRFDAGCAPSDLSAAGLRSANRGLLPTKDCGIRRALAPSCALGALTTTATASSGSANCVRTIDRYVSALVRFRLHKPDYGRKVVKRRI